MLHAGKRFTLALLAVLMLVVTASASIDANERALRGRGGKRKKVSAFKKGGFKKRVGMMGKKGGKKFSKIVFFPKPIIPIKPIKPITAPPAPVPPPAPEPVPPPAPVPVPDPVPVMESTLAAIQSRGSLRCGVFMDVPGFSVLASDGTFQGFEADLCRALGAAVFGTPNSVEFVPVTSAERFPALAMGNVDVLASLASHTMERDVYESQAQTGFTFSIPYLYSGLAFGGLPPFGACADGLDTTGPCAGLRVCVEAGTTFADRVVELLPGAVVLPLPSLTAIYSSFISGACNAVASDAFDVQESVLTSRGYTGDYELGANTYSLEPNALVTRDDDPQWSDLVNWVVQSILAAEEQSIAQSSASNFTTTNLFGDSLESLFVNAIAAVGNYAEIYERHLEAITPRTPVNQINLGSSGLILGFPFGPVSNPGPTPGGTLARIRERGNLRCGIRLSPGFAVLDETTGEFSGLDVDYCKAVSAAIFNGVTDTVEYTDLASGERFPRLRSDDVDLLSRITTWTFGRDVELELSFSAPTFYDGVSFGGIPPYGMCADNLDTTSAECQDLRICVIDATTTIQSVRALFPDQFVVAQPVYEASVGALTSGECNAITGTVSEIASASVMASGYSGPYEVGSNRYSKDPLSLVTRQDDPQFTDFVNWVVLATFLAEEQSIGQAMAASMPQVGLFGPLYANMLVDAIGAVGNYGEIYARNFDGIFPRGGLNSANTSPLGPQHYPLPGI